VVIQVDDWATLGVAQNQELREKYWEYSLITWPIFGFRKGDWFYGSPRGDSVDADVKGAGVHSGDQITDAPGQVSRISEPANREQENNGFISMNFFVFKDAAAKASFYETYRKAKSEDFA
jgi:hypothetical protein